MSLICAHSDNKVEEVHFNKALLSLGDRGALCHKEKTMTIKLTENEYAYANETDFNRIRSHVMNEVEEEPLPEGKYNKEDFLRFKGLDARPNSHMAIKAWEEYQDSFYDW